jgi:hypothetical protein
MRFIMTGALLTRPRLVRITMVFIMLMLIFNDVIERRATSIIVRGVIYIRLVVVLCWLSLTSDVRRWPLSFLAPRAPLATLLTQHGRRKSWSDFGIEAREVAMEPVIEKPEALAIVVLFGLAIVLLQRIGPSCHSRYTCSAAWGSPIIFTSTCPTHLHCLWIRRSQHAARTLDLLLHR